MLDSDYSYSVKNLKLYPHAFTPNKKIIITSIPPITTEKYPTNYKIKYSLKNIRTNTYKSFNKDNNYKSNYYTLLTNACIRPKFNLLKKVKKELLLINLNKKKKNENKPFFKKENFLYLQEKDSKINNIHINLMQKNKLSLLLNKSIELNNDNQENKIEEKKETKKLALKYISAMEKECNNINKNRFNLKKGKKVREEIKNTYYGQRMIKKDLIFEFNHLSNLPSISTDKTIMLNLWKKDMMKYCQLTMDIKNNKNKEFIQNLLRVYN